MSVAPSKTRRCAQCGADVCGFGFSEPLPPSAAAGVTRIERTDTPVGSLAGLEHFTGLEVLELHARDVSDLSPLAALSGLRSLTLHNTNIRDLGPLAGLRELARCFFGGRPCR